ncbi:MAG: NADH-quinone oxidoreductase subunit J [Acidobacteria bacterium]|nr:NADH-quinone oxidoreductase subunit J [Acidobacteriota bacterium]
MMEQAFFLILATLAVGAALSVIIQRSPLYSAFSLIGVFACLAGTYIMLKAQFLGAIQMIVYAGAIMVLFVFVIMLLNIRKEETALDKYRYLWLLSIPFAATLIVEVLYTILKVTSDFTSLPEMAKRPEVGDSQSIGYGLYTGYLMPFELTSILILLAIVGSVILARREKD